MNKISSYLGFIGLAMIMSGMQFERFLGFALTEKLVILGMLLAAANAVFLCLKMGGAQEKKEKNDAFLDCMLSAFAVMACFITMVGWDNPPVSYTFIIGAICGLTALGVFFARRWTPPEVTLARELGFTPAAAGLLGQEGSGMTAVIQGMEVVMDIIDCKPRYRTGCYATTLTYRVHNGAEMSLYAYPHAALDLNHPLRQLPPVINGIPYWGGCNVHGKPADPLRLALSEARKAPGNIFSAAYGFVRLELAGEEFRSEFELPLPLTPRQLKSVVDGTAELAAKLNAVSP